MAAVPAPPNPVGRPGAGVVSPRAAIWRELRAGNMLTVPAAAAVGSCAEKSAREFINALLAGGVLQVVAQAPLTVQAVEGGYRGPELPRLRADGSRVEQGSKRAAAWRAMRILGSFDLPTLVATSGIGEEDARSYCLFLARAGYLKRRGNIRQSPTYVFRKDRYRGPLAPQVTRIKCVWDPNVGEVVWPVDKEGGGA